MVSIPTGHRETEATSSTVSVRRSAAPSSRAVLAPVQHFRRTSSASAGSAMVVEAPFASTQPPARMPRMQPSARVEHVRGQPCQSRDASRTRWTTAGPVDLGRMCARMGFTEHQPRSSAMSASTAGSCPDRRSSTAWRGRVATKSRPIRVTDRVVGQQRPAMRAANLNTPTDEQCRRRAELEERGVRVVRRHGLARDQVREQAPVTGSSSGRSGHCPCLRVSGPQA